MEWIGKRVKSRSRQRLQVVNKRKKMEVEAPVISPPKKRRPRRRKDPDSDVEDITPTYHNRLPPPVQENDRYSAGLRAGSVQNNSVKESFSRIIRDLNVEKSGPSSSKFRDGSEHHTSVKETSFRVSDLDVGKNSVPSSFGEQNTCVKEKCSPEIEIGDLDVEKSGPSPSKLRDLSEPNTCVKEKCSPEIRDFDMEKSGPSSSKLRDVSEQNTCVKEKCSPEIRDFDVEKPGPSSSKLRDVSEQHTCVNEKFSPEITNLDVGISVPSSSKLREVSEQNTCVMDMCSPETKGLVVVKPVPGEIEILSDSESEIGARASAKKKLFEDTSRIVESLSDGNSTSETEGDEEENAESADNNTKDDKTVHSLPEVFTSEKAKEVQAPERPSTYRPEILSSVKAKEVQALEKPSRPEIQNLEKAKEVQAINRLGSVIPAVAVAGGLNKSVLANEPIDNQSDSSISSADKSGYESDPSLKDKEIKTNNNSDWRVLNGNHREVDLFRLLVNSVRDKGQLDEGYEEAEELVSSPEDQSQEQGNEDLRKYDDDGLLIIRPPPLIERFGMLEPPSPPEISESE
ncbi:PREDICTED: SNF2 domain-containing protein CLASSY 3-like [Camelina sativa]|uniref:SNF2 domain-containing protein CLASSY 3-like n=1 Tax=Camelina sativa TaxID=90675 RepID=A0ABM0YIC9_CAMSA|nr:PREDICTED: SNF2 domain-containing protein CLASSY 3-like [Camelina sativa]